MTDKITLPVLCVKMLHEQVFWRASKTLFLSLLIFLSLTTTNKEVPLLAVLTRMTLLVKEHKDMKV